MTSSRLRLDEACELTRTGDVWLFRGRSIADHAIRTLTNAPVNHVGMAVVIDDLPPLMWHAELGKGLQDVWTGKHQRGVQLHDLRQAVVQWMDRYEQRAWLRQLSGTVTPAMEDALLKTVARMDGLPFPSTLGLVGRVARGRLHRRAPAELAYCAEVVASAYAAMGLLDDSRPANYYDQPMGAEAEGLVAAAEALDPGEPPRAELWRRAVGCWRRRGRYADAVACAEEARRDGGPTWVDPRSDLLGVLLETGDPRADEVERELRRDVRAHENADIMMEMTADELHDAGRHRAAARWYSLVLNDCEPEEVVEEHMLTGVVGRRRQSRAAYGARPDRFDLVAERLGDSWFGDWAYEPHTTLLLWPDDELALLLERWPDLAQELGATPDEHRDRGRAALERMVELDGRRVRVTYGVLAELLAHAEQTGRDPRHGAARRGYAAELAASGRSRRWDQAQ